MCMSLRKTQGSAPVKKHVYKYYRLGDGELVSNFDNRSKQLLVNAPHQCVRLLIGANREVVSDRKSAKLTETEIRRESVSHGIHCYASKKTALRYCPWNGVVVQMIGKPKDFVAHGDSEGHKVFHRLTAVKIVAVGRSVERKQNDRNLPFCDE